MGQHTVLARTALECTVSQRLFDAATLILEYLRVGALRPGTQGEHDGLGRAQHQECVAGLDEPDRARIQNCALARRLRDVASTTGLARGRYLGSVSFANQLCEVA